MAVTVKELIPGTLLTASLVTLYTAPANTTARANEILLCNTDTVARTVTVHIIPSGGSASAANTIFKAITVDASETRTLGLDQVFPAGSFVQASADSASVVSIRLSGVEVN